MNKMEFLNLVQYVEEQKFYIGKLYEENKIVMSTSARNDLARIDAKEIAHKFTVAALAQWQQGNEIMNIESYLDYVITEQLMEEDIATSDVTAIQKGLNKDDLQLVAAAQSHWDSFCMLVYNQIENVDTLKIILRNSEKQRAISLGRETTLDNNDVAAFLSQKIKRVCDFLSERIRTLETISPVISGEAIEQSLRTTLTLQEFEVIINQLVDARYVAAEFKTNPALTEQWYYYALNTGKDIAARKCALKWISTTISLAQFVMGMINAGAIVYKENDKAELYQWVHRCISYTGKIATLEADMRRALKVKAQAFSIIRRSGSPFEFSVRHPARAPKGK